MKRRDFFEKSGTSLLGLALAHFGLNSCQKKEKSPTIGRVGERAAIEPPPKAEQKEVIQNLLVEKMGKSEEQAAALVAELEAKLAKAQSLCVCETCPSYLPEENARAFCHPLISQSRVITEEKGCDCPNCPVFKKEGMKNGYYCTRKSELEQEAAKLG